VTDEPGSRPGPAPGVDPEEFVATVEELYEGLDERRGVTAAMVADELDAPERTVRYHLNELSTQGRIADAWDHDGQPRRVYLPSSYE
jgi:predicted ArsR family transcriptional regulator